MQGEPTTPPTCSFALRCCHQFGVIVSHLGYSAVAHSGDLERPVWSSEYGEDVSHAIVHFVGCARDALPWLEHPGSQSNWEDVMGAWNRTWRPGGTPRILDFCLIAAAVHSSRQLSLVVTRSFPSITSSALFGSFLDPLGLPSDCALRGRLGSRMLDCTSA